MRRAVRAIVLREGKMLVMERNKFGQQYCTLVGGAIKAGEDVIQALQRELSEECGFIFRSGRHIFTEEAGDPYGTQYIFLCEADGAEPALSPRSDEAHINAMGQNLHTPRWLDFGMLDQIPFRSEQLKRAIQLGLQHGFPEKPILLDRETLATIDTRLERKEA